MKLLQQILSEAGADTSKAYTVVPGYGAYFKSVKNIVDYTPEKVVVAVGKLTVTVTGERLTIGNYFQQDLLLLGNVVSTVCADG